MGARAGWRWISVVVVGRFPVRLSLTRGYVLQDKRRRVRITGRSLYGISVVGFSLSIWLDRRSRLSGKFMWPRAHVLHKEWKPRRATETCSKQHIFVFLYWSVYMYEMFSITFMYTLSFVKAFSTTSNLCDLYQCEWYTVPLKVNHTDRLS